MNKSIADQLKPLRLVVETNRFVQHLTTLPAAQLREMLQNGHERRNLIYAELTSRKTGCGSNSKRRSSRSA